MSRYDYMCYSGVIKEYKPMNWRRRKAYSKRIDYALRYLSPPDIGFSDIFWVLMLILAFVPVVATPVLIIRWILGA